MKIVICPDSFKGSLTAVQAAEAMASGVRRVFPGSEIVSIPLADGGEGTVSAFLRARKGRHVRRSVWDPLCRHINAGFALFEDDGLAVVECAAASGLTLLTPGERDPRRTTSFGTGQLIAEAVATGVSTVVIGLGGSATNDGGAGALQALGAIFSGSGQRLDAPLTGADLGRIDKVRLGGMGRGAASFVLATDVDNPMVGPNGASMIYGPQKGGSPDVLWELDALMAHYAALLEATTGVRIADRPGAGAAGGLGGGLMAALGATARSGIDIVLDAARFEEALVGTTLVLTGEGSIDAQTLSGKAVLGVARRVRMASGPPVAAIGGRVDSEVIDELKAAGIAQMDQASPDGMAVEEAMANAAAFVADATARVVSTQL